MLNNKNAKQSDIIILFFILVTTAFIIQLFLNNKENYYHYNNDVTKVYDNIRSVNSKESNINKAYSLVTVNNSKVVSDIIQERIFQQTDTGYKDYNASCDLIKNPYSFTINVGKDVTNDSELIQKYILKEYNIDLPKIVFSKVTNNTIISLCNVNEVLDYSATGVVEDKLILQVRGQKDNNGNIKLFFKNGGYIIFYQDYDYLVKPLFNEEQTLEVKLSPIAWLSYYKDKNSGTFNIVNFRINKEDYQDTRLNTNAVINLDELKYIEIYNEQDMPIVSINKGE